MKDPSLLGHHNMVNLTKIEKLWFPCTIIAMEVLFLILFGVFVEYDDNGAPQNTDANNPPNAGANSEIQQFYPC